MSQKSLSNKLNFSQFIANRIKNIQASDNFAFASAIGLGPWIVPLAPAIIFGYALYRSAPPDMAALRGIAAVAVAIGLVTAGAISSHTAISSEDKKTWVLVFGYIFLEIVGLLAMSVTGDIKIIGTVASLLTLIVYLSRASAKKLDEVKAETKATQQTKINYHLEQARAKADHDRTMAARQAELDHAKEMAKIEAGKDKALAKIGTVPKQSQNSPKTVPPNKSLKTLKPAILKALADPTRLKTQIAQDLGLSKSQLYRHLGTLYETGDIIKNGNGYEVRLEEPLTEVK